VRTGQVIRALGPVDARSIQRDSLLAWMTVIPLLLGVLVRWLLPRADALLAERFGFDLVPYHHLVASYLFILLVPMTVGLVVGFLLLDERDDNTLSALFVTPLTPRAYLLYRLGLPVVLGTAMTAAGIAIPRLVTVGWTPLVAVLALAAVETPVMSLFLAAFAENKVQGFALVKGVGAVLLAPVVAWFVDMPWQLLAGVVPSYWPLRAYWSAGSPGADFWIFLAVGFVYHGLLLVWLLRRFETVLRR
jgi:fluoroquinolone transport system permease protein